MPNWTKTLVVGITLLGVSAAAYGLPWDIDMADAQTVKAYEQKMREVPEHTVRQENILTPGAVATNYNRLTPEGMALTSPYAFDDTSLAKGEKMYQTYCTPCHGNGENLGPVGRTDRFPGVVALKGASVTARTDGYLYLTIRNGGANMPAYGWAMDDAEMWSVVHYLRDMNKTE